MEDIKKIQEFFSKPLEENVDKKYSDFLIALRDSGITNMFGAAPYLQAEFGLDKREAREVLANWMRSFGESLNEVSGNIDLEDFNKVVKVLSASKYPFTIMLVPKWGEIDIITGQDSPDEIVDDISQRLDSAGLNWGGNSGITISGDSSNYSRKEYSDIFRVNGGHKDYFEESYASSFGGFRKELDGETIENELQAKGYETPRTGIWNKILVNKNGERVAMIDTDESSYTKDGKSYQWKGISNFINHVESVNEMDINNPVAMKKGKMPTQDQVDKFFALTQNETHYLNSKPVAGQEPTFNLMKIEPWDEYDLSNWNSLVRKAKQQNKEQVAESSSSEEKRIAKRAIRSIAKYRGVSEDEARNDLIRAANELGSLEENKPVANINKHIKAIQIQLQQMGVKYEMSNNPYKPFKAVYKPLNKDDNWYKNFDDIVFRYNLGGVVKTSMDEATKEEENEFHKELDKLVHKTFGHSSDEKEKMAEYIAETIKLGKQLNEELCEKGKRYIKARQAAGEKSSAYLSGRAVRVCKGQIEWPKKGKKKK